MYNHNKNSIYNVYNKINDKKVRRKLHKLSVLSLVYCRILQEVVHTLQKNICRIIIAHACGQCMHVRMYAHFFNVTLNYRYTVLFMCCAFHRESLTVYSE